MKSRRETKIAIIGGGIAGLTCAVMLEKLDYQVTVYEAAPKIRAVGAGIGLASNAITAFEYLGLFTGVKAISHQLNGFDIFDLKKNKLLSIDTDRLVNQFAHHNYAVHREDLHHFLKTHIHQSSLFVGKRFVNFTKKSHALVAEFADGSVEAFDYIIGADGVNSQVRQAIFNNSKPRYAGYWCWRNVVEEKTLNLHKSYAFWGQNGRFGITPLTKNRIYWFACINTKEDTEVEHYQLKEFRQQFKDYSDPVNLLLKKSENQHLLSNSIIDIKPLNRFYKDRILLIGDAAHAATPNMGQGACMAVEDVAVLYDELKENDFEKACLNFEKRRLGRTKYIIEQSRLAGRIAQTDQKLTYYLRNQLMRLLPDSWIQLPLKRLYEVILFINRENSS